MKKILIALDFHPSATKIIEAGLLMAKAMEANVVLLYVKSQLVNYSLIYKKVGSMKLDSMADLELAAHDFLEKSKCHIENNMIETLVMEGDFAEFVFNTAEEMKVDMMVMGSHSTKWLEEIVLGRVSNESLQQTAIPLLIIPTQKNDKSNTLISLNI
ncbi:MAG: universal stress protein [Paludibacter sp.]|nr:universal stress protein [Paludibacter sp.]